MQFRLVVKLPRKAGFTLIELSIVLVIVGLLAGGVLIGRDMIHAASLRASVSQLARYDAAVNAFREKYGGIPGDITPDVATAYGFFPGTGDGNGIITQNSFGTGGPIIGPPYGGGAWGVVCGSEALVFWRHLSDASMMDGSYGQGDGTATLSATGYVTSDTNSVGSFLPAARLGDGNYVTVFSSLQSQNYYILTSLNRLRTFGNCFASNGSGNITPLDAHSVDAKLDDGLPNSGSVVAGSNATNFPMPSFATVSSPSTCIIGSGYMDSQATYNTNVASGGNDFSCSLAVRFK
jgi:prepilin-type N-terminal cleavage/methylation domain-containing protein